MDRETVKTKAVRGVLWIICTRVLSQAISWLSTIVVIRILSPDDFGLMAMAVILVGFIKRFNTMGLGGAIVQKQTLDRRDLSTVFWFNIIVSGGLYLIVFVLAPVVADFFGNERVILLIRVLGLNLILGSLRTVQLSLLIKEMAFNKKAQAEMIARLVSAVTVLACAYSGLAVWSLVIGVIARSATLTFLVTYYYVWWPQWAFQPSRIKDLLRFGVHITGSNLLWYSSGHTDTLVVGRVLGELLLGIYTVAFILADRVIAHLSSVLSQVCFPVYAKLQNDERTLRDYFLKVSRLVALVVFPALTGLILVADDLFSVVLTEKWRPAVPVFQILCGVAMIRCQSVLIPPLLNAAGKGDLNLRFSCVRAFSLPPAFLVGSFFGLSGIAYAWLLVYPFVFFYGLTLVVKIIKFPLVSYVHNILPAMASTIMMTMVIMFLQNMLTPSFLVSRLVGSCVAGAVTYLIFIHLAFGGLKEFSFVLPVLRGQEP